MDIYGKNILSALVEDARDWIAREFDARVAEVWEELAHVSVERLPHNVFLEDALAHIARTRASHLGFTLDFERFISALGDGWHEVSPDELPILFREAVNAWGDAPSPFGKLRFWRRGKT